MSYAEKYLIISSDISISLSRKKNGVKSLLQLVNFFKDHFEKNFNTALRLLLLRRINTKVIVFSLDIIILNKFSRSLVANLR